MFLSSSRCLSAFLISPLKSTIANCQVDSKRTRSLIRKISLNIYCVLSFFTLNHISGTFFLFFTLKYHLVSFTKKTGRYTHDPSYSHSPCHRASAVVVAVLPPVPQLLHIALEPWGERSTRKTTRSQEF